MNDEFRIDESKIVVRGPEDPGRPGVLPTKEELLKICFDKEVHGFMQVDAYLMDGVEPAIQTYLVYGLMHDPNNPVSIQIAQGARKGEVLRLLSEVSQALEEDWHRLQEWDGGIRPKIPRDLLDWLRDGAFTSPEIRWTTVRVPIITKLEGVLGTKPVKSKK